MPDSPVTEIRAYLDNVSPAETADETRAAVLAVLDTCDSIRGDGGVGLYFAAEFEQTIARAFGITN